MPSFFCHVSLLINEPCVDLGGEEISPAMASLTTNYLPSAPPLFPRMLLPACPRASFLFFCGRHTSATYIPPTATTLLLLPLLCRPLRHRKPRSLTMQLPYRGVRGSPQPLARHPAGCRPLRRPTQDGRRHFRPPPEQNTSLFRMTTPMPMPPPPNPLAKRAGL